MEAFPSPVPFKTHQASPHSRVLQELEISHRLWSPEGSTRATSDAAERVAAIELDSHAGNNQNS